MWLTKLIPLVMGLARAGSKYDYAFEEKMKGVKSLKRIVEIIPHDEAQQTVEDEQCTNLVPAAEIASRIAISATAPPASKTKGRTHGK